MKLLLRSLSIGLLLFATEIQAQWQWLNPKPEGNELFNGTFVTPAIGWCVGGNGAIMKTTDGGSSWTPQSDPLRTTPFLCLGIEFINAQTGLISANNGTLLQTRDAGALWELLPSPPVPIQRLRKAPDGRIWGFGSNGAIAITSDVGLTWTPLPTGISTVVFDVAFVGSSTVFAACGGGTILQSTNAGQSWTSVTLPVITDVLSIEFPSPANGFALQSSKYLLRSTDSGQTWSDTTIFVNQLRVIRFADALVGWILSNSDGTVHRTTDGGRSWTTVTVDSTLRTAFQNITIMDAQRAILFGEGGGIFITTDGGGTWEQKGDATTRAHLTSVTGLDDSTAWVFGENAALFTASRGGTWTGNMAPAGTALHSGYALSPMRLVGGGTQGQVLLSTNGGQQWNTAATLATAGRINQIMFTDVDNGWLVGNHGTIARSTDGGGSWTLTDPGMTDDFNGIMALSSVEAWAVGNGGRILHTTDGGQIWTPQVSGTNSNLHAVCFTSPTTGWAGGQLVLLKTTDGGSTWNPGNIPGFDVVYRIRFTDAQHGYFLLSRSVARTKDGGVTFYRTDYPATGLQDISAVEGGYLWLAGEFGTIQRYTPAAAILIQPETLNYGDVATNRQKDLRFSVENTGEVAMDVTNVVALGLGFSVQNGHAVTLSPGQKDTVTIRFAPPDTGMFRGLATVQSNAALGLATIGLIGHGVPPGIPAFLHSPDVVDFGKLRLGNISTRHAYLQNRSQGTILVNDERISGGDSLAFQLAVQSVFFFPPGFTDSVRIVFAPQIPGVFNSDLLILSNDPVEPAYRVPLRGEAINPHIYPSPSQVDFGWVYQETPKTLDLYIRNTGTDALLIFKDTLQGIDAAQFSCTRLPRTPIAVGDSALVRVTCAPTALGRITAELYIESDDIINPGISVPLVANATNTAVERVDGVPRGMTLRQNYPNPVSVRRHGSAGVEFEIDRDASVDITAYDMLGRSVGIIVHEFLRPGIHRVSLDVSGWTPGAYALVMRTAQANGAAAVRRVIATVVP